MATVLREQSMTNAKSGKPAKGGRWVTLPGGQHVLLSGGKLDFGGPPKTTGKHLTAAAHESLKQAQAADSSGDHEAARHHRAAAHGFHRAAGHLAAGDRAKAEAVAGVAHEYATGKRKLQNNQPAKNQLHELVAKLNAARLCRETLHGREYLIVPTTIMRPDSVMNGSKGPLFYPRAEVAKNPGMWNGVPLLLNHPSEGTTGRDPRILAQSGLGYLFNDRLTGNGNRVADAWFDVELVRKRDADLPADKQMLPRLESGKAIDVSTGLYTEDRPVKNGVKLTDNRGRPYTGTVATNYRPDHLAVLPTTRGACAAPECGTHVANMKDALGHGSNPHGVGPTTRVNPLSIAGKPAPVMKLKAGEHVLYRGEVKTVKHTEEKQGGVKVHFADGSSSGVMLKSAKLTYNAAPSGSLDMSPDKACKIVKDGSVNGHPLTKAQRGMFGALCGTTKNREATAEELAALLTWNRDWPQAKRDALPSEDFAGPNESFPIKTQADVEAAKHLVGKAADPEAVKARIKAIAKRKGLTVPEAWNETSMVGVPIGPTGPTGSTSDSDLCNRLHAAITAKTTQDQPRPYVRDVFPHPTDPAVGHFVYDSGDGTFQHEYKKDLDTGAVSLKGKPVKVQMKTFYEPATNEGERPMALTKNRRKAIVTYLTTNCACWKGKDETLNEFDDETLSGLGSDAEQLAAQNEALDAFREVVGLDSDLVLNAETIKTPDMKTKMKKACADVPDEPEPKKNSRGKTVRNASDDDDFDERVQDAITDHPAVKNAERIVARETRRLRDRLTAVANHKDTPAPKKKLILNKLKDESLGIEALEETLTLVGEPPARNARHPVSDDDDSPPDYTGAGSGHGEIVGNSGDDDPTENAEKMQKFAADGGMTPSTDWGGRIKEVMNGQNKGRATS